MLFAVSCFATSRRSAARLFKNRAASAAVVFSLAVVPVVLFLGATVDYARYVRSKADLQQAVDSAVLAGVRAASTQRTTVAGSMLSGAAGQATFAALSATWKTNADGSFTGAATASLKLLFASAFGVNTATIGASATAAATSGASSATKVCALVLDPASSQTFLVTSNVTINAPSCEIDVVSTAAPAAIFNSGDTFNLAKICVAGGNVIQNGGAVGSLARRRISSSTTNVLPEAPASLAKVAPLIVQR